MYFDTHAHYDSELFDADRDAVLASLRAGGVDLVVDPASDIASAEKARAIAEKFESVYFAAGVHPQEAAGAAVGYQQRIRELASHPKCVALGEIGLDYHYDLPPRDVQRRILEEQLLLAEELGMPVIIHEREATGEMLEILRRHRGITGVVHCFSGSWETARELLDMGWFLSFTGVITFKNARRPCEVAARMPLDRLMLETDSPYLTPVPHRGERNSSLMLPFIAERISQLRGIPIDELVNAASENGRRFFRIEP